MCFRIIACGLKKYSKGSFERRGRRWFITGDVINDIRMGVLSEEKLYA